MEIYISYYGWHPEIQKFSSASSKYQQLYAPPNTMLSLRNLVYLSFLCSWYNPATACLGVGNHDISHVQVLAAPAANPPKASTWKKIALKNVRVFDGTRILPPSTVIIDGPRIGLDGNFSVDQIIDGDGDVLIPGLIDSHAHPANLTHLQQFVSYGVTTVMSMTCTPEPNCNTLRGQTGLADFHTAGMFAVGPNGTHAKFPVAPSDQMIRSPADASAFVSNRVGNGTDFIKTISEPGGMTQQDINAIVSTAHAAGMLVMAHADGGYLPSFQQAIDSGADNIQHITTSTPITAAMAQAMRKNGQISTPTLSISQSFIQSHPTWNYSSAQQGVTLLYNASVPILAGTDANTGSSGTPVSFGISLHGELELLNKAGLSTLDALRAATRRPAHSFGLYDRGVIKPGYRADLVLIRGDPLANISNTRNIQRVWAGGIEVKGVVGGSKR